MSEHGHESKGGAFTPHQMKWTDKRISRLWHYYSVSNAYDKQYFSYQAGNIILKEIGRYIPFKNICTILDYGCGPGFLMEKLVRRLTGLQKCYGLDFSKEAVSMAERKCTGNPHYGKAVWVEKLPSSYKDASMDVVISLEVIEHLDDSRLDVSIDEINRLLKPGGYVALTTPNRENLEESKTICPECGAIFHRWQHVRTWTAGSLCTYMERAGFKTITILEKNFASKFQTILKYLLKRFPEKRDRLLYIGRKSL